MTRRTMRAILVIATISAVLFGLWLALMWWGDRMMEPPSLRPAEAAQRLGVTLPSGAVCLGAAAGPRFGPPGMGEQTYIKLRLPEADLKPWLAANRLAVTDSRTDLSEVVFWLRALAPPGQLPWWDPHEPRRFRLMHRETPAPTPVGEDWKKRFDVLIDLDEPGFAVVYLETAVTD
jgi:hypothetical protein